MLSGESSHLTFGPLPAAGGDETSYWGRLVVWRSRVSPEIFVMLLDEGVDVWRPVRADHLEGALYRMLDQPRDDGEKWQFPPGSRVICERRELSDGWVLAAARAAGQ
jgi:hypothetical protein